MVGFEVSPRMPACSIVCFSLPLRSDPRVMSSCQTLWPCSKSPWICGCAITCSSCKSGMSVVAFGFFARDLATVAARLHLFRQFVLAEQAQRLGGDVLNGKSEVREHLCAWAGGS